MAQDIDMSSQYQGEPHPEDEQGGKTVTIPAADLMVLRHALGYLINKGKRSAFWADKTSVYERLFDQIKEG